MKAFFFKNTILFYSASGLLTFLFLFTVIEAYFTTKAYQKVSFKFNDKLISSSKDNFYVGTTENYLILFNNSIKATSLYKMSEVKELIIYDTKHQPKNIKLEIKITKPTPTHKDTAQAKRDTLAIKPKAK